MRLRPIVVISLIVGLNIYMVHKVSAHDVNVLVNASEHISVGPEGLGYRCETVSHRCQTTNLDQLVSERCNKTTLLNFLREPRTLQPIRIRLEKARNEVRVEGRRFSK